MGALERLYRSLEPLKLYALRTGGLVDCELAAYGVGLEMVEVLLEEIRTQAFVQTATGEGLQRHEQLVGVRERPGSDPEERRELVLYRLAVAPFDFHLEGMLRSVRAAGLEAEIEEHFTQERLTVRSHRMIDSTLTMDLARSKLDSMLPAHLEYEFDVGELTWNLFDAAGVGWDGWDGLDFTWEEFDLDGHLIFYGGA